MPLKFDVGLSTISRKAGQNPWCSESISTELLLIPAVLACRHCKVGQMVLQYSRQPSFLQATCSTRWRLGCPGSWLSGKAPVPSSIYRGDNLFKKPRGFLKSDFLIDVSTHFLWDIRDTAIDFGPPQGLFVLILTAVRGSSSLGSLFIDVYHTHCSMKRLPNPTRQELTFPWVIFVPSHATPGWNNTTRTLTGRLLTGGTKSSSAMLHLSQIAKGLARCRSWMRRGLLCPWVVACELECSI